MIAFLFLKKYDFKCTIFLFLNFSISVGHISIFRENESITHNTKLKEIGWYKWVWSHYLLVERRILFYVNYNIYGLYMSTYLTIQYKKKHSGIFFNTVKVTEG